MPADLTPFLHETWFEWLNGMSHDEYLTIDSRIAPADKRVLLLWMVRQSVMEGWAPEDVANALTHEERDVLLRLWQNIHPASKKA
jgi:hypothetical protein